jgi:hypothetical protein
MLMIYIDADACPVKEEAYRVARRYNLRVAVVANAPLRVPAEGPVLVVRPGFGVATAAVGTLWLITGTGTAGRRAAPRRCLIRQVVGAASGQHRVVSGAVPTHQPTQAWFI